MVAGAELPLYEVIKWCKKRANAAKRSQPTLPRPPGGPRRGVGVGDDLVFLEYIL